MGGSLVASMGRPIRGKLAMEHEEEHGSIDYEEDAISMPQKPKSAAADWAQSQQRLGNHAETHLELFVHRKYSLPERPDVEIERTVWAYREKRQ